ncbi:MAG: histidine kinase, partial [Pseudomonadales bacterium]|nr:histidine kinase [Pseudomonadales bacterium]
EAGAISVIPLLICLFLAFGAAFYRTALQCLVAVERYLISGEALNASSWWTLGLLQYLLVFAIAYVFSLHSQSEDIVCILLLIITPQLAIYFSTGRALAIAAIACIPVVWTLNNEYLFEIYLGYMVLHSIFIGIVFCSLKEQQTKNELIETNRKLLEAQFLLADKAKQDERLRISRDLHDRVGHHLTALSLQLEITQLVAEGSVKSEIARSQELAKALLSDVRDAVNEIRHHQTDSLNAGIRDLIKNLNQIIPDLNIQFTADVNSITDQDALIDTLLNSLKELLTNALKHGRPSLIMISLSTDNGLLSLSVQDDGQPLKHKIVDENGLVPGNGLLGIRERVSELKGSLSFNSTENGFLATITVPTMLVPTVTLATMTLPNR